MQRCSTARMWASKGKSMKQNRDAFCLTCFSVFEVVSPLCQSVWGPGDSAAAGAAGLLWPSGSGSAAGAAPAAAGLAREAEAAEAGVGGEAGGGPRASAWHAAGPAPSAPLPGSHWLELQGGRESGRRLDARAVTSRHLEFGWDCRWQRRCLRDGQQGRGDLSATVRWKRKTAPRAPDTCRQVLLALRPAFHTHAGAHQRCTTPGPTAKHCNFPELLWQVRRWGSSPKRASFWTTSMRSLTTSCWNGLTAHRYPFIENPARKLQESTQMKHGSDAQPSAGKITSLCAGFQESKRFKELPRKEKSSLQTVLMPLLKAMCLFHFGRTR